VSFPGKIPYSPRADFLSNHCDREMKRAVEHSNNGDSTFPIEERKVNNLKSMGTCYEWKRKARSKVKGACTVELLRRRFPILKWLPSYNWDFAVYDVIAGITVGLTTIP
jgi:sodium-independent sulfate anion transporter 11